MAAALVVAVLSVAAGGTFVTRTARPKLRAFQRNGQPPAVLPPREREVIRLIAVDKRSKEAGRDLAISPRTIDTYPVRTAEIAEALAWIAANRDRARQIFEDCNP